MRMRRFRALASDKGKGLNPLCNVTLAKETSQGTRYPGAAAVWRRELDHESALGLL